ncbi:MAG: trypsin-like peptidase domain-containing protein, partial [bacterium]|nr:trypsin-like peptidase domain-containing protein [bacterium]
MKKRTVILAWICLLLSSSAAAVLIDSRDGSENTTAPIPDPGWAHIGVGNGLTAVYLGEGWVLSAAHAREIKLTIDGGVYPPVTGSRVVLLHAGATESDVELFRIDPYPPSLPRMPIRSTSVRVAERVLMAGHGRNRGPAIAWRNPPTPDGYGWGTGKRLRWGTNVVSTTNLDVAQPGKTTRSFSTTFSRS